MKTKFTVVIIAFCLQLCYSAPNIKPAVDASDDISVDAHEKTKQNGVIFRGKHNRKNYQKKCEWEYIGRTKQNGVIFRGKHNKKNYQEKCEWEYIGP
eukprot:Pgem_evm1s11407